MAQQQLMVVWEQEKQEDVCQEHTLLLKKQEKQKKKDEAEMAKTEIRLQEINLSKEQALILKQQKQEERMQNVMIMKAMKAQQRAEEIKLRKEQALILKQQKQQERMQNLMKVKAMKAQEKAEQIKLRKEQAEILKQQKQQERMQNIMKMKAMKAQERAEEIKLRKEQALFLKYQKQEERREELMKMKAIKAQQRAEEIKLRKEHALVLKQQKQEERRQELMKMRAIKAQQKAEEKKRQKQQALILKQQKQEERHQELIKMKAIKARQRAEEIKLRKEKALMLKMKKQEERMQNLLKIRAIKAQQRAEKQEERYQELLKVKAIKAQQRAEEIKLRKEQAENLKQQKLEERQQRIMKMKAMKAQKRAEERELLMQKKRKERSLKKDRMLELRRLKQMAAKELKKPSEDLCLRDQMALPELSRLPSVLQSGASFKNCLIVMDFLQRFGAVLGLGSSSTAILTLNTLQSGLLNLEPSAGMLQEMLIRLLSAALRDPGIPKGQKDTTDLGDHVSAVPINQENVSEILHIYLSAHSSLQTKLCPLAQSLRTKSIQALMPAQKASLLVFLVNELASSKAVAAVINKNLERTADLRREKCVIDANLRKLKSILAQKTGRHKSAEGGEVGEALRAGHKRKMETEDSGEDEVEKKRKVETSEEEDIENQAVSVEELEQQIEKIKKELSQASRSVLESSQSLRSMLLGQDRYKRRYWVLPKCGGVFVEATETEQGPEELHQDRESLQNGDCGVLLNEKTVDRPAETPVNGNVELEPPAAPPSPLPIPEDMASGWWMVSSAEELKSIISACHPSGIREKELHQKLQTHMDYLTQLYAINNDATVIDVSELEQSQVCEEMVRGWSVEERAMDQEKAVLQQVEKLECRVVSACLQVKGWMPPEPQSQRDDLRYYEHHASYENNVHQSGDQSGMSILRYPDNPLDIAVLRLSELEQNLQKRGEEDKMMTWRKALSMVCSSAQLSLCLQQLQSSIVWKKSSKKMMGKLKKKVKKRTLKEGQIIARAPKKAKNSSKMKLKLAQDKNEVLRLCRSLMEELQSNHSAWPLMVPDDYTLDPVSSSESRTITKFSTVCEKLSKSQYENLQDFYVDVNSAFDNIQLKNNNLSIQRASRSLKRLFQQRWTNLTNTTN